MEKNNNNMNLFNAAIVGENPEAGFLVEGKRLHATDPQVASLKKDKSKPELIIPLMQEALKDLVKFAQGKVPPHFLEIDWNAFTGKANEQEQLIAKIEQIYTHLPHVERNKLSTLIHHATASKQKKY